MSPRRQPLQELRSEHHASTHSPRRSTRNKPGATGDGKSPITAKKLGADKTKRTVSTKPMLAKARLLDPDASRPRFGIAARKKKDRLHEVERDFDALTIEKPETKEDYITELTEAATSALDTAYEKQCENVEAGSTRLSRLVNEYEFRLAKAKLIPLADETIIQETVVNSSGTRSSRTFLLGDRIAEFERQIGLEKEKIEWLEARHEACIVKLRGFAEKLNGQTKMAEGEDEKDEVSKQAVMELRKEILGLGVQEIRETKSAIRGDEAKIKKMLRLLRD